MTLAIRLARLALLAGAALAPYGASAETSGAAALQGAWLQPSVSCDQVYVATKKGMAFRKPVSMFAPALMISGNRIITPGATCRIVSITPVGTRKSLSLSCATSISSSAVTALLSIGEDGSLHRYTSETDIGSRYERCGQ